MKIYIDDERSTPGGWVRVYWPDEAIKLLKSGDATEISLDHDLGDDDRGTGYDVLLWVEGQVTLHGFVPPLMKVHSANVSARTKMIIITYRQNCEKTIRDLQHHQIRYDELVLVDRFDAKAEVIAERGRVLWSPAKKTSLIYRGNANTADRLDEIVKVFHLGA